jgi:hypothetical protein
MLEMHCLAAHTGLAASAATPKRQALDRTADVNRDTVQR